MDRLDLSLSCDREHLQKLLVNSISVLCQDSVNYQNRLSIEGLLGITVDDETVLLINVNELFRKDENDDVQREKPPVLNHVNQYQTDTLQVKTSSSRRKCKVTRKAVVHLENDCKGEEFYDDWDPSPMADGHDEHDEEMPLNLVKCENHPLADENENVMKPNVPNGEHATTSGKEEVADTYTSICPSNSSDPGSSAELNQSWPIPNIQQGNIRKYGSYGYIINHGNDVMFSCNQCPKVFRNRVSLWRHGVKHKTQQSSLKKALTSGGRKSQGIMMTSGGGTSQAVIMQSNLMKYQTGLGIKSSPVSSYGVLSQDGAKSWYTCIVCQDKFTSRAALWRHKAKHGTENHNIGDEISHTIASMGSPGTDDSPASNSPTGVVDTESMESTATKPLIIAPLPVTMATNGDITGHHSNSSQSTSVRRIGSYGYVVTTPDGKIYHCNDCSKSFRNRVSLWKHQTKHQVTIATPLTTS